MRKEAFYFLVALVLLCTVGLPLVVQGWVSWVEHRERQRQGVAVPGKYIAPANRKGGAGARARRDANPYRYPR